ncbi:hypothetical protein [Clostridium magnum]|uniref:hypothetical protein n=1 Tax=Clostridium magnum TaxID=33954 RepID=UPI00191BD615|nr:hypothetical protein [Clostridium magnum]
MNNSSDINIKEAFLVTFGLTFNNLGTGVATSITGVSIQFTVMFTFIFSILTIIFDQLLAIKSILCYKKLASLYRHQFYG